MRHRVRYRHRLKQDRAPRARPRPRVAAASRAPRGAARATPPQPGGGGGGAEPDPASGDDDSERDVAPRQLRFESPVKPATKRKRKQRLRERVEEAANVQMMDARRRDAEAEALDRQARRCAEDIRKMIGDDGTLMAHMLTKLGRDRGSGAAMMQAVERMYPVFKVIWENAQAFLKNFPTRTAADRRLKNLQVDRRDITRRRRGRERARLRPARRDHHRGHPDGRGRGRAPI